ncbi:hypothetical protein EDD85DRAFT_946548 [Armillaria nabsnona]|nr:hypothetical protein EDD85DRAFT_946548 [Armillaria nabsnona]
MSVCLFQQIALMTRVGSRYMELEPDGTLSTGLSSPNISFEEPPVAAHEGLVSQDLSTPDSLDLVYPYPDLVYPYPAEDIKEDHHVYVIPLQESTHQEYPTFFLSDGTIVSTREESSGLSQSSPGIIDSMHPLGIPYSTAAYGPIVMLCSTVAYTLDRNQSFGLLSWDVFEYLLTGTCFSTLAAKCIALMCKNLIHFAQQVLFSVITVKRGHAPQNSLQLTHIWSCLCPPLKTVSVHVMDFALHSLSPITRIVTTADEVNIAGCCYTDADIANLIHAVSQMSLLVIGHEDQCFYDGPSNISESFMQYPTHQVLDTLYYCQE